MRHNAGSAKGTERRDGGHGARRRRSRRWSVQRWGWVLGLWGLAACSGHYDAEDFDLTRLKPAALLLFEAPTDGYRIEPQWWPPEVAALRPESVTRVKRGIYIQLDSLFVEARGIFIPTPGTRFEPGQTSDPSIRALGEGLYSYHFSG